MAMTASRAGGGNDALWGGNDHDTVNGGSGNDTLGGDDGRDVLIGGEGDDYLNGGNANDSLQGDNGADTLAGGAGDDAVSGGAGSDFIFGADGFDFINGGWGNDRLNGGNHGDVFFHAGVAGHGLDWIQDYDVAEGDVLSFGIATASETDFIVTTADSEAGNGSIDEAFVTFSPTGQVIWALVDGAAQSQIIVEIGGVQYDLLA